MVLYLSCPDQTSTRLSRDKWGQGASGWENGDLRAGASASAVPTFVCFLTHWPGSTTCPTLTGEPARSGKGSETVPVGLRSKSTSTPPPTRPSGGSESF